LLRVYTLSKRIKAAISETVGSEIKNLQKFRESHTAQQLQEIFRGIICDIS